MKVDKYDDRQLKVQIVVTNYFDYINTSYINCSVHCNIIKNSKFKGVGNLLY